MDKMLHYEREALQEMKVVHAKVPIKVTKDYLAYRMKIVKLLQKKHREAALDLERAYADAGIDSLRICRICLPSLDRIDFLVNDFIELLDLSARTSSHGSSIRSPSKGIRSKNEDTAHPASSSSTSQTSSTSSSVTSILRQNSNLPDLSDLDEVQEEGAATTEVIGGAHADSIDAIGHDEVLDDSDSIAKTESAFTEPRAHPDPVHLKDEINTLHWDVYERTLFLEDLIHFLVSPPVGVC